MLEQNFIEILSKLLSKFLEKFDFRKTELPENSRKCFQGTQLIFIKFFSTKNKLSSLLNRNLTLKNKKKVSILSIVTTLCSKSIDSIDTKFFRYLSSLVFSERKKWDTVPWCVTILTITNQMCSVVYLSAWDSSLGSHK